MPDIDFQKIELNLIPKKGDEPVVFYASQYETTRPFIADLFWGESEFTPGDDCWAEIDIRKNDDNLVVITEDVAIDNNEVSVILPVQAVTCIGKNLGQVKIYAGEDQLIAALNFILEVQADPLAGGVTSETAIDNLTQQIEDIAQEVISEDYYDKSEVDALLADKADVSDLPDMTDYYTKTATDALLSAKANTSDLATVATTGNYGDLLNKPVLPDMTQYYTKSEVDTIIDNIFPTFTASGPIASFTTALNKPLVSVTAAGATIISRCGINLWDEEWELGGININTGENSTDSQKIRSKDYCLIGADLTYYIKSPYVSTQICFYDSAKNYINYQAKHNATFTTPANACYFRLRIGSNAEPETTYNNDISINIHATDTLYHASDVQTVPIADATTLTTLSGVNNVLTDIGNVTVQYKYMSI